MGDDPSPRISPAAASRDGPSDLTGPLRLALNTPVREYPPMGDRKAVAVLATNGLMLSVLLFVSGAIHAVVAEGEDRFGIGRYVVATALVPFAGAFLVGTWASFRALTMPITPMPESLAFFSHIARLDREEYRRRVKAVGDRDALRDMLYYNDSLAVLNDAKFRLINRAVGCSRLMVPLWAAVLRVPTALRGCSPAARSAGPRRRRGGGMGFRFGVGSDLIGGHVRSGGREARAPTTDRLPAITPPT